MNKRIFLALACCLIATPALADRECVEDERFAFNCTTRHKLNEIDDTYLATQNGREYLRKKEDGKEVNFLKKNPHPKGADIKAACVSGELEGSLCKIKSSQ